MGKENKLEKQKKSSRQGRFWWGGPTIHGSWFGFFNGLIFVSELRPGHPVLRLFLLQTLLQSLQFVVQVNFQVVLFLRGAARARFTFGNMAEAFQHRSGFSSPPSPGYCSSPGLVCVLLPLLTGWASDFCCPLVTQPSLLRMVQQKALCYFQEIAATATILPHHFNMFYFLFRLWQEIYAVSTPNWLSAKAEFLFFSHLEAPWSPRIPGCSSSSPSRGCFESPGPPSPAGPFLHLWHGSSPAAPGSSSPAGSSTWPFPCGFSVILLLCLTPRAGSRWPLPTVQRREERTWSFL